METIMWCPNDRKEELLDVCKNIEKKDESFIWFEREDKIVIVSDNSDIAHRRGMWFIHKFDSRIKYEVR